MIKPLRGYILIKPTIEEEGIIVTTQEDPDKGVVIDSESDIIKKDQKVIFSRHNIKKVAFENIEFYLLKEEDILAILQD